MSTVIREVQKSTEKEEDQNTLKAENHFIGLEMLQMR